MGSLEKFGKDQARDTPISEKAIAGCIVGNVAHGLRSVMEIMYVGFNTIAINQIMTDGEIIQWKKKAGCVVAKGDQL